MDPSAIGTSPELLRRAKRPAPQSAVAPEPDPFKERPLAGAALACVVEHASAVAASAPLKQRRAAEQPVGPSKNAAAIAREFPFVAELACDRGLHCP
jgi:hypothetical protein